MVCFDVGSNVGGACHYVGMSKATDSLIDSAVALASVWAGALTGFGDQVGEHVGEHVGEPAAPGASCGAITVSPAQLDVETMSDAGLLRAIRSGYDLKRQVDSLLVRAAGELSVRSRPSLGQGGLAKSSGHTSPGGADHRTRAGHPRRGGQNGPIG